MLALPISLFSVERVAIRKLHGVAENDKFCCRVTSQQVLQFVCVVNKGFGVGNFCANITHKRTTEKKEVWVPHLERPQ